MFKKTIWLVIGSSILIPLLLSCTDSSSPYTAANATISIMLENSSKQRSTDAVADTVDKTVRVGISAYLPQYITSVFLSITKSPGDTDTTFTFTKISDWPDTHWIPIAFHSAGTRTVAALAVIPEAKDYPLTAQIVIAGKPSSVTYDGNGNTGGTVPVDANFYQQGAAVTVKANVGSLVRTGYTFAGWNTAANGSGTSYAGGEAFTIGAADVILYAKWTQNPTYTVTYNGNGNTGGTVPTDANAYEQGANVTVKANTGNLTKTSYTFAGWNTAADGKGTSYAGGETFSIGAANVTLYAKWTQNPTYTVTYNGNGNTAGTAPADANAYEQGASVIVKANTGLLAKTGFTFAGWNTVADGSGTSYAGAETFNIGAANVTLHAKWTQNATYTVTYNGNGSTSGGVPTDANAYELGASVTVKTNSGNLAKTGYTFAGWNTANDGTGTSYAGGETLNIGAANIIFYAKWTQNPTYTVTYDGNGSTSGSVPIDANAYEQGANVTVKANTGNLVKTSYTFAGWNTAADGKGTSYAGGETFNIGSANVTLYAKWTQNPTYTVTYNGNGNTGGTAPADANAYLQGDSVTVKTNTGNLVKTGNTFAGWNTAADGSGTSYAAATKFAMGTANITLYAKWTQNPTYTVSYNGNGNTGGTAPADANAYLQGDSVTVKANTGNLVKTGNTFAGWNTAADGSGTSYAAATKFAMGTTNVTLYAKWTQNPTYTVTYNGNGNTGGTAPADANSYEQNATVTVKANTGNLVRTSYTFAGWNTAADGSGTSYAGAATFTMGTTNVTLYAKWTQNPTYTVTYNGNGNTGGTAPTDANSYEQNATVTVKANTGSLVKTGCTFAGWNTAADGSGTSYAAAATFTMGTATVILYAKWTINIYTVKFNSNGGSSVDSQNITYNTTATAPSAPTRSGYLFAGWFSDQALTNQFNFLTPITAAITLYAKWTAVYSVTYNGNGSTGGTVPVDNSTYSTGATVTVLGNTGSLVKTGNIFAGWNTAADGSGASYAQSATFAMGSANVILYAKWTPVYTVTYSGNGNTSGTAPVDANNYTNGTTVTVLDNTGALTKTGYTFSGWNTNAAGTGTDRTPGSTFAIGSTNVTLYAKWSPNSYTVNFDGQGATTAPYPLTITVTYPATTVGTLPSAPLKTSYVFDGWWTGTKGTGTAFTATTPVTQNITVYAKWSIKDADGNVYTEVTIGSQVWMVQNLMTTQYNNNTSITYVADKASWAADYAGDQYCWYNGDPGTKNTNGALYNWYAASNSKLAPKGWHVATDAEWNTMVNTLGGAIPATANMLMARTGWSTTPDANTNSSGFTAYPTGLRTYAGDFMAPSDESMWWASTYWNTQGYLFYLFPTSLGPDNGNESGGKPVRCVRD